MNNREKVIYLIIFLSSYPVDEDIDDSFNSSSKSWEEIVSIHWWFAVGLYKNRRQNCFYWQKLIISRLQNSSDFLS